MWVTLWIPYEKMYTRLIPVSLYIITDACVSNWIEFDPHNKCACVCKANRAKCVCVEALWVVEEWKNIAHKFIINKVTTKMLARRIAFIIKFLRDSPLYQTVYQSHLFLYSIFTNHSFQNEATNTDSLRKLKKKMNKSLANHATSELNWTLIMKRFQHLHYLFLKFFICFSSIL